MLTIAKENDTLNVSFIDFYWPLSKAFVKKAYSKD